MLKRFKEALGRLRADWKKVLWDFRVPVLLAFMMAAIDYSGILGAINGSSQDAIWLRHGHAVSSEAIVVLEIDDRTYGTCFHSHSPMDANALASLVERIACVKAAVVGVDVLTAADEYGSIYRKLADELKTTGVQTVWISGGSHPHTRVPNFFAWLGGKSDEPVVQPTPVLGFDPGELTSRSDILWGPAVFPTEEDSKLRRFPRTLLLSADPATSDATERRDTWARVVAREYCKRHRCSKPLRDDDIYLSVAGPAPPRFSVLDFLSCSGGTFDFPVGHKALLQQEVKGKVLLLGGTFAESGDFHETAEGNVAGIFVNARAIAAEIASTGFREMRQPNSFFLDIFFGCLVIVIFAAMEPAPDARTMMRRSALVAAAIMAVLYMSGYMFSVAAVVIGTVLQQLYDFWDKNLKMSAGPGPKHSARQGRPGSRRG